MANLMYISIGDTAVYNATDAAAHAASIDLVYLYRNITTSAFNHALVAPAGRSAIPAGRNPAYRGQQDCQTAKDL